MYHKIAAETPTMWWVSADAFYRQMWELRGRKVVYLDDYAAGDPAHVCITFDGVYENVAQFAAPILERFGYPYELFVVGDSVGQSNEFDAPEPFARIADREQLRSMVERGARLQWHTRTHPRLTDALSLEQLREELRAPEWLREIDPKGLRWLAYPHGEFTSRTIGEARRVFAGATSCHQGNGSAYELNRLTVVEETKLRTETIGAIVPSYNYGAFLPEAVESLLRQTIVPDRILILDDGSSDDTEFIGRALQDAHPRLIEFHRNGSNQGIVSSFNKALEMMETDYVVFLGADNRFVANYVERCAEVLLCEPAVGVAYTDMALFGPRAAIVHQEFPSQLRGRTIGDTFWMVHFPDNPKEVVASMTEGKQNVIHGSAMFRREIWKQLGGYREKDGFPEDFDFFRRVIGAGWEPRKAAGTYLEYRHHSTAQASVALQAAATTRILKDTIVTMQAQLHAARNAVLDATHKLAQSKHPELQIFADHGSGFSEESSMRVRLQTDDWQVVRIDHFERLQPRCGWRLDPVDQPALVLIRSIYVRRDDDDAVLFAAEKPEDFAALVFTPSLLRHADGPHLLLLATDYDPQILLPAVPGAADEPCHVEIAIKAEIAVRAVILRYAQALDALPKS